jgi:predicted lipid-binding transport protein (Tim44 family)
MGNGFQALDIILFAALAAFLVLRLRSVLGRRTGHHRRPPDSLSKPAADSRSDDNVIELPDRAADGADTSFDAADGSDPLAAGLTQIRISDPAFDPALFIQGARAAFEMIVQAFAGGDTRALRTLLNDEVFENFAAAIAEREKSGETLETTVIAIKSADIIEARIDGRTAFVTVKFLSEQVNVTRYKDGEVIDGDPNHVTDVTDIWTFARNTRARDPNWMMVETQSPN